MPLTERAFLDALREHLQGWSLSLHDPHTGGFRRTPGGAPCVMGTTDIVWLRHAVADPEVGAPDINRIVHYLQAQQDAHTGKVTHGPEGLGHSDGHAFWQTVRALRILGADLAHFPDHLRPLCRPAGLQAWFTQFQWDNHTDQPCGHHHEVLGLVPIVVSRRDPALTETFFRNLARQQNPVTGTWPASQTNISRTFAYTALHLSAGRLPAMPERIVDEMLRLQHESGLWDAVLPNFHTMDAAYLLVRLPPQIGGYRRADAVAALRRLSVVMRCIYASEQKALLNSTHQMLAITHTYGLLQEAFPDEYPSERPYRFDWDRLELYDSKTIRLYM